MGYCEEPGKVLVTIFKESGKWYTDLSVNMSAFYEVKNNLIHTALAKSLDLYERERGNGPRYRGMWAVCIKPYHETSFPIMMKWDGLEKFLERQRMIKARIAEKNRSYAI